MNIKNLPTEILTEIFTYLPYNSIIESRHVCKLWRDVSTCRRIWDRLPIVLEYEMDDEAFTASVNEHKEVFNFVRVIKIVSLYKAKHLEYILTNCPNINKLHLIECDLNLKMMKHIDSLSSLEELIMIESYVANPTSEYVINFCCHPLLKTLRLSNVGLSDGNFEDFLTCQNLEHLMINEISDVSQENIIKLINQQKDKLKTLCLFGGDTYDDTILEHISDCPNISHLQILSCLKITNSGLKCLNKLYDLRILRLGRNDIFTAKDLMGIFRNGNLQKLVRLALVEIKNVDIELLDVVANKCPDIKFLRLAMCPLLDRTDKIKQVRGKFPNAKVNFTNFDVDDSDSTTDDDDDDRYGGDLYEFNNDHEDFYNNYFDDEDNVFNDYEYGFNFYDNYSDASG